MGAAYRAAPMLRGVPFWILLACACSSTPRTASSNGAPGPTASDRTARAPAPSDAIDPSKPTLRLPRNFLPTMYRVHLAIDPASARFHGSIEIDGDLRERSAGIWLHGRGLNVTAAKVTGRGRSLRVDVVQPGDDLLSLRPAEPLDPGRYTLALDYDAAFDTDGLGVYKRTYEDNVYVATQFEPIRARRGFPCFDEPDNKVPWQLTLDVPRALLAVSNAPVVAETALDAATRRVAFAPTKPLPSYLVAFAVGPYELVDLGRTPSGTPMRIITVKGRANQARYAAETTPRILAVLEDYFGSPYPYEKLDQLSRPVQSGGAMEHPGLIGYGIGIMLHDPAQMTHRERVRWMYYAAHELAHQWFGDLVTHAWWDDLWLNEGFANWLGAKVQAELEPSWRGELIDNGDRDDALNADSAVGARRVRQPIARPGDIFLAFDAITYDKGQSVLAMFERAIGPERFRDGVRAYVEAHRFGNATSADFIAAISRVAGRDLAPAFGTFLDQVGAPLVSAAVRCEAGRPTTLRLAQRRYVLPGAQGATANPWHIPVCIAYDRGGARGETCTELTTPTVEVALDIQSCPAWVFANAGGKGYYRTSQPEAALVALRDHGWKQLTPVERMVAFQDVSALASIGEIDIGVALSFVPKLMAENHRFAVSAAVTAATQARAFIDPAKRSLVDAWIRKTFGPAARAFSWRPRASDDLDAEDERATLVPLAAQAGDPVLRAAAIKLAANWRTMPMVTRRSALAIAADADRRTFDRMLAAAPTEKDPALQVDLIRALAEVTDAAKLRAVLALVWDRRLSRYDVSRLATAGATPALRSVTAAYFRDHLKELLERYPDTGDGEPGYFAGVLLGSCDAEHREENLAFVKQALGGFAGADRVIARSLESLDSCVALRRLLAPRYAAWLERPRDSQ
jgi:cytosol alanyl aminopeptidase